MKLKHSIDNFFWFKQNMLLCLFIYAALSNLYEFNDGEDQNRWRYVKWYESGGVRNRPKLKWFFHGWFKMVLSLCS